MSILIRIVASLIGIAMLVSGPLYIKRVNGGCPPPCWLYQGNAMSLSPIEAPPSDPGRDAPMHVKSQWMEDFDQWKGRLGDRVRKITLSKTESGKPMSAEQSIVIFLGAGLLAYGVVPRRKRLSGLARDASPPAD